MVAPTTHHAIDSGHHGRNHRDDSVPARRERALQAMAEASLRARLLTERAPPAAGAVVGGEAGRDEMHPEDGVPTAVSAPQPWRPSVPRRARRLARYGPSGSTTDRTGGQPGLEIILRAAIAVVAVLLAAMFAALLATSLGSAPARSARVGTAAGTASSPHGGGSSPATPPATAPAGSPRSSTGTGPAGSAVPSPAPSAGPQVAGVSPDSGGAGQRVTVTGTGFFSPDGRVQAEIAGDPVATDCPTQTSCTVTVPPLPGPPRTVPLTLVTATGGSNSVSFTYTGAGAAAGTGGTGSAQPPPTAGRSSQPSPAREGEGRPSGHPPRHADAHAG